MERLLLIKYGEIHLKGNNRPYFIRSLKQRLMERMVKLGARVWEKDGRMFILDYPMESEDELIRSAADTFGVVGVCPALGVEKELSEIYAAAKVLMHDAMQSRNHATFKVKARRQDKTFSPSSTELAALVGGAILDEVPNLTVDVHHPEILLEVEIRDKAYLYGNEIRGVGGLPVGVSGKGLALLSGGIDSPVAIYMMAKRGLGIEAVHFLSPPYTGEAAKQKVLDLAKRLTEYCGAIRLHLINFTEIQEQIYEKCSDSYLTIIMRRLMCAIAEKIAGEIKAGALVTGESLGQVASQTIAAIQATNSSVQLPIFRPLIGMDKSEIIEIARRIGTFELSIREGEDCCTVFVPKHPALRPQMERVLLEQEKMEWIPLVEKAVKEREILIIEP